MVILRIEHKVPNFDGWKRAFEADPINRKRSGVIRYGIFQPTDDLNYVIIDLEFKSLIEAENTLISLQALWKDVEGKVMLNPKTQLINLVESSLV
jgi:hypothetical protein